APVRACPGGLRHGAPAHRRRPGRPAALDGGRLARQRGAWAARRALRHPPAAWPPRALPGQGAQARGRARRRLLPGDAGGAIRRLLIISVVIACVAAGPAAAKMTPGCAGLTVEDQAGDGYPFGELGPGPNDDSVDVTAVFFRAEGGRLVVSLRLANLVFGDVGAPPTWLVRMFHTTQELRFEAVADD